MTTTHPAPPAPGSAPSPAGPTPRRSLWASLHLNTWRGRFAWVMGFAVLLVATGVLLSRATPFWYRPLDKNDQTVNDLATRANILLTYELRNTAQRVPLGEQRWRITQDELNSYLATNLGVAFDSGGGGGKAPPVSRPCVSFSPGQVTVSARSTRIPGGGGAQGGVGTLVFSVGIVQGADGKPMGLVKLTGVWIGYLPVPMSLVRSRLQGLVPAVVTAVEEAIELSLGARDPAQWESATDKIIESIGESRPFPLQYRIERKDLVIRELTVDDNAFTLVVAPAAPVAGAGGQATLRVSSGMPPSPSSMAPAPH
jgi:hypothetical protein